MPGCAAVPRITGREGVQVRLNGLTDENAVRRVGGALFAGGELIRGEASHMLTEGAVSGKGHVPSLPGEPPNEDTGTLRTHIETTQPGPLKVEVSSNAPYSAALEFGSSTISERPFMRPATARKRKEVVALVRRAVTAATKR
jgi:HK97 gp10 family phage protein